MRQPIKKLLLVTLLFHLTVSPDASSADLNSVDEKTSRRSSGLFGVELDKPLKLFCAEEYRSSLKALKASNISNNRFIPPSRVALLTGINYFVLRDFPKAYEALHRSRKYRKSNSDTLYLLGVSLFQIGRKEEALKVMDEAIWFGRHELIPLEVIFERKGLIFNNLGQPKEAAQAFNRSAQVNPHYLPARLGLARYHLSRGELPAALSHIRLALPLVEAQRKDDVNGGSEDTQPKETKSKKDDVLPCEQKEIAEVLISSRHNSIEVELLSLEIILSSPKRLLTRDDIQSALSLSEKLIAIEDQPSQDQLRRSHNAYVKSLILSGDLGTARQQLAESKEIFKNDALFTPLSKQLELEIQSFGELTAQKSPE